MKPAGARALLTYDPHPQQVVEVGDYIRTRTGRTYLIDKARKVTSARYPGRLLLTTTVMPADHEVEPDAVVHSLHWYSRNPNRGAS